MKRPRFRLFVAGILLAFGLLCVGLSRLPISGYFCVSAHFARLPMDDKPLENWLKTQPGMVAHTVNTKRKGDQLYVAFIKSQSLAGNPPFPKLSEECARLGYESSSEWKDDEWPNGL